MKTPDFCKPLNVTSEHSFFIRVYSARSNLLSGDDDGEWHETRHLQTGDEIKLASGNWAQVVEVKFKGEGQVYNFLYIKNRSDDISPLRFFF